MNPLLDFGGLPRFPELKPEHVAPALDELLAEGRAATRRALEAGATWDAFVAPLEDANERIGRAWGQVSHLHAVLDSPELRTAYNYGDIDGFMKLARLFPVPPTAEGEYATYDDFLEEYERLKRA